MSLRSEIFKGAIVLTGGQAVTQALSFARNIIIARLLSPENMGIAATFAITITLLEMISNLAVDMLLVQAKDGDDPVFQGTAHLYQMFRGLFAGLVIFSCAPIITWLFNTPQVEWAFRLVALVPIFRGFTHLDWKRLQRKMQYRSTVLVEVIPQAVITLAAFPMAIWLGDYSTVLWLVLIQAAIGLLVSHLFAQRSYQLNWDREYATRLLVFGWPLLINGLLMFGALQGDRLIIGTFYSMTDLGVYSVSFSIVLMIAFILTKISTSLLLPFLAEKQDRQIEFRECYIITVQVLALIGGVVALPFITAGGNLVVLIFGEQYEAALLFAPYLGGLIAVRIFRLAPTIASLARGDTKNSMIANLFRFTGVATAIVIAWYKLPLSTVIICGIGGETLAFLYTIYRLQRLQGIGISGSAFAPVIVSVILFIAGVNNIISSSTLGMFGSFGTCLLFVFVLIIIGFVAFPTIQFEVVNGLTRLSGRSTGKANLGKNHRFRGEH